MKTGDKLQFRWMTAGYFTVLLLLLIVFFGPSLNSPLRSDWWSALYAFHLVDASPGPPGFEFIVNHDPWRDGTFRPLAHPLLYLEHSIFAANFFFYHLTGLLLYFFNVVLLYLLGRRFRIGRGALVVFLSLFAFLFSHFDVVVWTFHSHLLLSFSLYLSGFYIYLDYLDRGRNGRLILVGILFLGAMLLSELYLLWPFGIIFLNRQKVDVRRARRFQAFLIAGVYGLYLIAFLLTKSFGHTSGAFSIPTIGAIFLSAAAVPFNLLYNGIMVNLCPLIALPIRIACNVEIGGMATAWGWETLKSVMIVIGILSALIAVIFFFRRDRIRRWPRPLTWMAYLYGANFYILALARSTTENIDDIFFQFRYQYIPNALLCLAAALIVDHFIKGRTGKKIVALIVLAALVFNLVMVRAAVSTISSELEPLQRLLNRIQIGIDEEEITLSRPISIPDGITSYLPELCWNRHMERFFRGTYQWAFSREDIFCFTPFIDDAAWVADGDRLDYRPRDRGDPSVLPQRKISSEYLDRAGSLDLVASEARRDN